MFEWKDVSVSFGEKSVLRGCSISGEDGARIALMGPSGCGKTTLLRVALALQEPDSGSHTLECPNQWHSQPAFKAVRTRHNEGPCVTLALLKNRI